MNFSKALCNRDILYLIFEKCEGLVTPSYVKLVIVCEGSEEENLIKYFQSESIET